MKPIWYLRLFLLIILSIIFLNLPISYAEENDKTKMFWEQLSTENYEQALNLSLELGQNNPVYFELAYYLEAINFRSSHLMHQINQEIQARQINAQEIKLFEKDMNKYLVETSPYNYLVKAIIEFNEHDNQSLANQLVSKAFSKKETILGNYVKYSFQGNVNGLKKASIMSKNSAFMNKELLVIDYNKGKINQISNLENLLSNDDYYFDKDDYLNFILMGLGQKFDSGIGPSGPNNEPYFGELCQVTDWGTFKKFAPRHQILFTFAVGGPGGQNSTDAEKLLSFIDEKTKIKYAPIVRMLRIYESFHDYQYEDVYKGADDIINMKLNDPFYFMFLYDLAYEYEMFYFSGYYPEQTMINKSISLYDKAYLLTPKWSIFWKESVLQGKGRSQFYAQKYQDSIITLKQAIDILDDPICYFFLSLDYYAIKDSKNGTYWEGKTRKAFIDNENILSQYDEMLKKTKN